ncbi:MAG: right-handed parallel beta-helix repeat-containing protein, partial [Alphaproteobacteria bacterium]|nr:right-handed parallel beta-helix repeat-containing protein [Alphaproteobacteria bacterium]
MRLFALIVGCSFLGVAHAAPLAGVVREDPTASTSGPFVPFDDASVRVWADGGDGLPTGADDVLVSTLSTAADGSFSADLPEGVTYWVGVGSFSLDPPALRQGGNVNRTWAEQVAGPAGSLCADGLGGVTERATAGACYGGRRADVSDVPSALSTAEHVARVELSAAGRTGLNFTFSYVALTTTRTGSDSANRNVQGGLQQVIRSANELTGPHPIRFVPVAPPNATSWWRITLPTPNGNPVPPRAAAALRLPDGATLDGRAWCNGMQCAVTERRDANPGTVFGNVVAGVGPDGVPETGDEYTVLPFVLPELELEHVGADVAVLVGEQAMVAYTALHRVTLQYDGDEARAENNLVGYRANGTVDVPIEDAYGIDLGTGLSDTATVHNLVSADNSAIRLDDDGDNPTILHNEIRVPTGGHAATFDGILFILNPSETLTGGLISHNVVQGLRGAGIEVGWSGGLIDGPLFLENTVTRCGLLADGTTPSTERVGVIVRNTADGSSSRFRGNLVERNGGPGFVIQSDAERVTLSKNVVRLNQGAGIDLDPQALDPNSVIPGDGVTPNDGVLDPGTANQEMDYPVLTAVAVLPTAVFVRGYVGTISSPIPGVHRIELFRALDNGTVDASGEVEVGDGENVPHGEAEAFIGACNTDASGAFSCFLPIPSAVVLTPSDRVTATATHADGHTSECGTNAVQVPCLGDVLTGDSDGDGYCDDIDDCLGDDTVGDDDDDGVCDDVDECPTDPDKILEGQCGCFNPDTDTDTDGTADCVDDCPQDGDKTEPGDCGCGTPDTDADGDGTPDCFDSCPDDPDKVAPGECGCGTADTDTDSDNLPDCLDDCPDDPLKVMPGECGCGVADTDTDTDNLPDCLDDCPNDPLKVA